MQRASRGGQLNLGFETVILRDTWDESSDWHLPVLGPHRSSWTAVAAVGGWGLEHVNQALWCLADKCRCWLRNFRRKWFDNKNHEFSSVIGKKPYYKLESIKKKKPTIFLLKIWCSFMVPVTFPCIFNPSAVQHPEITIAVVFTRAINT